MTPPSLPANPTFRAGTASRSRQATWTGYLARASSFAGIYSCKSVDSTSAFSCYCEDVDLSFKLAEFGRLVHVDTATFEHPVGRRSFKSLHRNFRNHLIVMKRHRKAEPTRMLRDGILSLRQRDYVTFAARLTGTADYLVRARRWA